MPGQEVRKDPSRGYLIVQTVCRADLALKDGVSEDDLEALATELLRWAKGIDVFDEIEDTSKRLSAITNWVIDLGNGGSRTPRRIHGS